MNRNWSVLLVSLLTCFLNSSTCYGYINSIGRVAWNRMTPEEKRAYQHGGMPAVEKLRDQARESELQARQAAERQEAALHEALTRLAAGKGTPADRELVNQWRKGFQTSPRTNPPAAKAPSYPPENVTALTASLQSRDERVRHAAAYQLRFAGEAGKPGIPMLLTTLADPDSDVRFVTAGTLGELGAGSQVVLRSLVTALSDSKPQVRRSAAQALGNLLLSSGN